MNKDVVDAEFKEMTDQENTKTLATLDTFQLYRHNLKNGTTTPEIERIAKELELDKQLGLKNQAEFTAEAALKHDIDELTTSNDYVQVSKGLLEKLFSIKKLQFNCWWYNLKSWISGFIFGSATSLIFLTIMVLTIYPLGLLTAYLGPKQPDTFITFILGLSTLILWVCELCLFIAAIVNWCTNFTMQYEVLKVRLDMTPIKKVDIKIPYGAKLKVQEAFNKNIFEDFILAKPVFSIDHKETIIDFKLDPAILGITKDSRMFMIVYWDMQKDKERILKEINRFKKYKLTN